MSGPMLFVPHTPPRAPEPEPEAILRFGEIEIRIGLTFLHHLINCQGWGDRESSYVAGDQIMREAMTSIERAMWASVDAARETKSPKTRQVECTVCQGLGSIEVTGARCRTCGGVGWVTTTEERKP